MPANESYTADGSDNATCLKYTQEKSERYATKM